MTDKQNVVSFQGKLHRIELRYTSGGIPVCEAGMSINRKNKQTDDWESAWFNVTAWRDVAEQMGSLPDKSEVVVHGYLDLDPGFTTRSGEQVPNRVKVTVERIDVVGAVVQRPVSEPQQVTEDLSDVPF